MNFKPLKAESPDFLRVDLIRFIASIGIVWHHSHQFFYPARARQAMADQTAGLALFVDLFFVISGFIIAVVYGSRMSSISSVLRFLQRRAGRLIPLHWLTLAIAWTLWSLIALADFPTDHPPELGLKCVAETALLLNGFIVCGNGIVLNGVTWSISVEMVFYFLFPLFALTLNRPRLLLALTAISLIASIDWWWRSGVRWDLHIPLLRGIPAFLLGVVIAKFRGALGNLKLGNAPMIAALGATIALMLSGAPQLVTLVGTYCVVVLAVAADSASPATGTISRLAPLGQLTYSIYLWHGIFITVLMNGIADKLLKLGPIPMFGVAVFCYGSILLVSYASLIWFENPARRYIDNLGASPRHQPRSEDVSNLM